MNRNRLAAILDRVAGNSQVNQLETIAEQWLENSRMRVKESSYIKYRNLLQNHILPCMGKTDVAELTTEYIGNFIISTYMAAKCQCICIDSRRRKHMKKTKETKN